MTEAKNEAACATRKAGKPVFSSKALLAEDVPAALLDRMAQFRRGLSDDECWLWPMAAVREYGRWCTVRDGATVNYSVPKSSYAVANGVAPAGLLIRHKCDTPRCYNPKHLTVGTQQDNINDMQERGRSMWSGTTIECRRSLLHHLDGIRGNSQSRTVVAPDGRTWPSTVSAARDLGVSQTIVARRCRQHTRGWHYA